MAARTHQTARKRTGDGAPGKQLAGKTGINQDFDVALDALQEAIESLELSGVPYTWLRCTPFGEIVRRFTCYRPDKATADEDVDSGANNCISFRPRILWNDLKVELDRTLERPDCIDPTLLNTGPGGIEIVREAFYHCIGVKTVFGVEVDPDMIDWINGLTLAVEERAASSKRFDMSRLPVEILTRILTFAVTEDRSRAAANAATVSQIWAQVYHRVLNQRLVFHEQGTMYINWLASRRQQLVDGREAPTPSIHFEGQGSRELIPLETSPMALVLASATKLRSLSINSATVSAEMFTFPSLSLLTTLTLVNVEIDEELSDAAPLPVPFSLLRLDLIEVTASGMFLSRLIGDATLTRYLNHQPTDATQSDLLLSLALLPSNLLTHLTTTVFELTPSIFSTSTKAEHLTLHFVTDLDPTNSLTSILSTLPSRNSLRSLTLSSSEYNRATDHIKSLAKLLEHPALARLEELRIVDVVDRGALHGDISFMKMVAAERGVLVEVPYLDKVV